MSTSPSVTPAEGRLPRQVIRMRERADELIRDRNPKADDSPAPGDGQAPAPGVAADATPAPVQPSVPQEPTTEEGRYWHQRFKVVDGMFRKDRTKHHDEIAAREARIAELEGEVARLKTTGASETPAAVDLSEFYTPEEIEALGEEQARANATAALKAAQKQVKAAL